MIWTENSVSSDGEAERSRDRRHRPLFTMDQSISSVRPDRNNNGFLPLYNVNDHILRFKIDHR